MIESLSSPEKNGSILWFPRELKTSGQPESPDYAQACDEVTLNGGKTGSVARLQGYQSSGNQAGTGDASSIPEGAGILQAKWLQNSIIGLFVGLTLMGAAGCGSWHNAHPDGGEKNAVERVVPGKAGESGGIEGEAPSPAVTAPSTQFDIEYEIARLKHNGEIAGHLFETIVSSPGAEPHTTAGIKPLTVNTLPLNVITIQVPVKEGQRRDGPDQAPPLLESRAEQMFSRLADLRTKYIAGDFSTGQEPLILVMGGDHSIAAGTLPAYRALFPDASVVWVDAHGDINTFETSPSKNPHGMPVAVAVGRQDEPLKEAYGFVTPRVQQDNVAYWGLRDLDPGEVTYIAEHGPDTPHTSPTLINYSMEVINQLNQIGKSFESQAQEFSSQLGDSVVISFDVDGLDPQYTPSTGTPVKGGLTLQQSLYLMAKIQDHSRIKGMDVVEVNPLLGNNVDREKTLSCAGIVSAFPSLNRTILDIASKDGVDQAVKALTEYTTDMGMMKFENGRSYKVNHIVEMASVIVHNLGEKYEGFSSEQQAASIRKITSNLMTRRSEQDNPLFIPLLLGSLTEGLIGLTIASRRKEAA